MPDIPGDEFARTKGSGTTEAILIKATQPRPHCLPIAEGNHLYRVKEMKVSDYTEIHFYLFSELQKLSMKMPTTADYNRFA